MKKNYLLILCFLPVFLNAQTPQTYTTFQGATLNLYKYEGTKTMILADSNILDATVMSKWVNAMDGTYDFYYSCTGQYPICYTNVTCFNGKSTISKVASTCGAGCGYLGWTGIELQTSYFDDFYNDLLTSYLYSQEPFYEFGRNFWFFDSKLKYKSTDPVVTGYAIFMRFMAMEYIGVQGSNFGSMTFPQFQNNVRGLLTTYMADPNLNWGNTLGMGQGVPNSGFGGGDLFASFCFYLKETYGMSWVQNVWKKAAMRPDATTTQDAVDNFIIASSQAAKVNLVPLFQQWKWTPSNSAIAYLNSYFTSVTLIPDSNFENKLIALGIDTGTADGKVLTSSISSLESLDVSNSNIIDLTGIQFFTALKSLNCNNNQLLSLDVSKNVALNDLSCYSNRLTNLDVSKNTSLKVLKCYLNQLNRLEVSQNTLLTNLECYSNLLMDLNVSKNTSLTNLLCSSNRLTHLDVFQNSLLKSLECYSNLLTDLNVSKNTALTNFLCSSNQLTALDLSKNTALTVFSCDSNFLTRLNIKNGNNVNFLKDYPSFKNNPNLSCIQVDDVSYSNANWASNKDATANYSTGCNAQARQSYTTFQGAVLNLYKYEGTKTMILADSDYLDASVMTKWVNAMDGTYDFYYSCTGQYPNCYTNITCINGKSTIAEVPATCGTGCGYLGTTGIEIQTSYFDKFYNNLLINNQYDQLPFFEFGRNYWFLDSQLKYKSTDPVASGYAVFMRFMAMEYIGVQGANYDTWTFSQFQNKVMGLLEAYMADPNLNWSNTLGVEKGVPNSGFSANDLFASFCFNLKETYGMSWVQNVWKMSAMRPDATTTQDAVDNFIIASSQAAKVNLVSLFQKWKWTPSNSAIAYLNSYFRIPPSNNFTVVTKGETCTNENNGEIDIVGTESNPYKAIINGKFYDFVNNKLTVNGLAPGDYTVTITIPDKIFEQKFNITIAKAANITGKSSITNHKAVFEIATGTAPYTIYADGIALFETSEKTFTVDVSMTDVIEVVTAKACEGVLTQNIKGLEGAITAYPIPTTGSFEIQVPIEPKEISATVYNTMGIVITTKTYSNQNGKLLLSLQNQPEGIYVVRVDLEKPQYLKIIKK